MSGRCGEVRTRLQQFFDQLNYSTEEFPAKAVKGSQRLSIDVSTYPTVTI